MYKFIESSAFSRYLYEYLSEEEYATLQWRMTIDPTMGDIIRGSGGVRKLRWSAKGKGKRGGVRVIYYWHNDVGEIWLLTLYAKNEADTLPTPLLKKMKEAFASME